MQGRSWIYTLNNYSDEDINQLRAFTVQKHRSCKEVGESATPHLQGAITFTRQYTLKQLKKLNEKIHWELAKSKDPENYCTKGEIIIDVNQCKQGKRNDLEIISSKIKDGSSLQEIASEYPKSFILHSKGFQSLINALQPRTTAFTHLKVIIYVGGPGTGKTRRIYENEENPYNVMEPINGSLWFDGYTGQEAIILDDFYGWIKYHTLLQLLDGYPMQLPIKGSTIWKNWNRVYITSNKHPTEWYSRSECDALLRRITEIITFI